MVVGGSTRGGGVVINNKIDCCFVERLLEFFREGFPCRNVAGGCVIV